MILDDISIRRCVLSVVSILIFYNVKVSAVQTGGGKTKTKASRFLSTTFFVGLLFCTRTHNIDASTSQQ